MAQIETVHTPTGIARRRQILDSAIELFSRRGYNATSLSDLAESVGIRKATLYHYINSKSDVLEMMYDIVRHELLTPACEIDTNLRGCERLSRIIRLHVNFQATNADLLRVIWKERNQLPAQEYQELRDQEARYEREVRSAIALGISEGCVADCNPDIMTSILLSTLTAVHRWVDKNDIDAVVEHIYCLVFSSHGHHQRTAQHTVDGSAMESK